MARTAKTPKSNPNTYEPVSASEASPRNTRRSTRASSKATNTSASAHSRQNSESLRSTPVPNKMTRSLPERFNPRLADDVPPYETLVKTRKNGVTNLGVKNLSNGGDGGLFSYVHLKAPLPKGLVSEIFTPPVPECYFLMKRASDNFVSATGMFKAAFPWAKRAEEEEERRHIRATYPNTSKEETAGNLWVHPADAQILAEEYGMHIWIKALLDPVPVGAGSSGRKSVASTPAKASQPPQASQTPEESGSPAPSEKPVRRSTRSASPSKSVASPRKRAIKTPRSRIGNTLDIPDLAPPKLNKPSKVEQIDEIEEKVETTTTETVVETKTETEEETKTEETKTEEITTEETTKTTLSDVVVPPTPTKPSRKSAVKVEAQTTEETDGDVIVKETNVKVALPAGIEMPESTEEMIAKAKEMVEAAKKLEGESGLRKRKADDIAMGDADNSDDDDEDEETKRAKRTKVQNQLRREKVKTRALIGLSATLVVGALLPYVL